MRRIAILLIVVATAIVMAVPAGAKKPPRPDDPPPTPEYYTMDIAIVAIDGTHNGIATTCGGPSVVRRDGIHFEWYSDGDDPADDDPMLAEDMALNLTAPGLRWDERELPECPTAGIIETTYLDGSHETAVGPGYFRVTLEEDDTVAMLWIFDTLEEVEEIALNRKRTKLESMGRTDFRMGGPYDGNDFAKADSVTIDDEKITIAIANRPFAFVHYDSGADPVFVDLSDWIQTFSLTITLTPVG